MLQRVKNYKKKILIGVTATTAAVAVVAGAIYTNFDRVMAKSSLPGVEIIVSNTGNSTPFKILEVVPSLDKASLGYLVAGEEPIVDAKSISEMPVSGERTAKLATEPTGHYRYSDLKGTAFTTDDTYAYDETNGTKSLVIRGKFVTNATHAGDYDKKSDGEVLKEYNAANLPSGYAWADYEVKPENYSRITDEFTMYAKCFDFTEDPTGTYRITELSHITGDEMTPVPLDVGNTEFNWQYFKATQIYDSMPADGRLVYSKSNSDSATDIAYFGVVGTNSSGDPVIKEDGTSNELLLTDVQGASNVTLYYTIEPAAQDGVSEFYKIKTVESSSSGFSKGPEHYEDMFKYDNAYTSDTLPAGWTYYFGNKDHSDYKYNTTHTGEYDFVQNYAEDQVDDFKYNGGITNNEWFKKFVFDIDDDAAALSNMVIDVVTVTPEMITTEMLESAGLIYFAGESDGAYYAADLDSFVAASIVRKAKEDKFPVIIERSTLKASSRADFVAPTRQINQLAAALMVGGDITSVTDPTADNWGIADATWDTVFANLYKGYTAGGKTVYSNVNGSVYVNDDILDGSASIVATAASASANKIVSTTFDTKFADDITTGGFASLISEIESENVYLEAAKKPKLAVEASIAKAIRHILNAGGRRNTTKEHLRILDIEPMERDQYDKLNNDGTINTTGLRNNINKLVDGTSYGYGGWSFDDFMTFKWMTDNVTTQFNGQLNSMVELPDGTKQYMGKDQNVLMSIRQMGTKELIGKSDDLNETYDMIFIGADTAMMNTKTRFTGENGTRNRNQVLERWVWNTAINEKTPSTLYNDASMDGLIYSHLGDSNANPTLNNVNNLGNGSTMHIGGNDITEQKYNELVRYLDAGYAIVVSDLFFYRGVEIWWNIGRDNEYWNPKTHSLAQLEQTISTRIDSSSYMYKFIMKCFEKDGLGNYKYYGKNVFRRYDLEKTNANSVANIEEFNKHLNIAKMQVVLDSKPKDYNTDGYLTDDDGDGIYTLDYVVSLKNDAAVGVSENDYSVKLYIDADADGKYESDEELKDLDVTRTSDGSAIAYDKLKVGSTYKISRDVPEGYVGCLSWKLVFSQIGNSNVYRSVTGFSAVSTVSKPEIRILQISAAFSQEHLDLTGESDEGRGVANNAILKSLYAGVNDFDIKVTRVNADDYIKNNAGRYAEYLSGFDMVVMGFSDQYSFTDRKADNNNQAPESPENCKDAVLAIRDYALSGRSVLFTHDLTYFNYNRNPFGYYVNRYLRDVQGMDRYGFTKDNYSGAGVTEYKSQYDTILKIKGNDVNDSTKWGFSDSVAFRVFDNNGFGDHFGITNRNDTRTYNMNHSVKWDGDPKKSLSDSSADWPETVTMINEGQITRYPYLITTETTPTFAASSTHSQYFQLNMDTTDSYWLSSEERKEKGEIEGDDVTVWYVIGNRAENANQWQNYATNAWEYYKAIQKDVRNDYYLYSRGNVFYTGAGHSFVDNELERKLFVNTLVAAYNAGIHAPKLEYKENGNSITSGMRNNTISDLYIPFDGDLAEFLSDEDGLTINFRTKNVNIKNNSKPMYAKFYISVPRATQGAFRVGNQYYKQVSVTVTAVDGVAGTQPGTSAGGSLLLTNYTTYSINVTREQLGYTEDSVHSFNDGSFDFFVRLGLEELDPNNTLNILPASESMTPLSIFCTELLELE